MDRCLSLPLSNELSLSLEETPRPVCATQPPAAQQIFNQFFPRTAPLLFLHVFVCFWFRMVWTVPLHFKKYEIRVIIFGEESLQTCWDLVLVGDLLGFSCWPPSLEVRIGLSHIGSDCSQAGSLGNQVVFERVQIFLKLGGFGNQMVLRECKFSVKRCSVWNAMCNTSSAFGSKSAAYL